MRELYGDWRDIFKGFRIALDPRKITLAVAGIFLSGFWLFVFVYVLLCSYEQRFIMGTQDGLLTTTLASFRNALASEPALRPLFALTITLTFWAIWAYFAGAISRIAAVEIARDESIETKEALKFAASKYRSLVCSPIAVLIAIVFFGACNAIFGLLGRIPLGIGQLLVSVPLILALFSGFLMALLLVGLVCAWPLMIPTVCVEGTDSFDAISRSLSYLYARPWRYLWCKLVSVVYGIPCIAFVALFTLLFVHLGLWAGRLGMGSSTFNELATFCRSAELPATALGKAGAVIFSLWILITAACIPGYAISYFLTQTTTTYLILRKAEDGTEMTEVYEEEGDDQWEPGEESEKASEEPEEKKD